MTRFCILEFLPNVIVILHVCINLSLILFVFFHGMKHV